MKNPKFGKTKLNSFVEFDTEIGRLRLGSEGKKIFLEINEEKKYLTDVNGILTSDITGNITGNVTGNVTGDVLGDLTGNVTGDVSGDLTGDVNADIIRENNPGLGVTIEQIKFQNRGIWLNDSVVEYVDEILIPADKIVGTGAGALGHADGVALVPVPGAGYVHEFVSAVLIYDFDTAAFTGGAGDDLVIRIGSTTVSPAVATADLIAAAADQIVHLRALAAADYDLPANATINLKSTAVTNPGLPEIFTLQVTLAESTGGNVVVTLDGVAHDIPVTNDTVNNNAIEIQTYIDALPGYSATVLTDTVTVTAATNGTQTDATFAQGTAASITATIVVTQQGADDAAGVLRAHVTYRVHTTNL